MKATELRIGNLVYIKASGTDLRKTDGDLCEISAQHILNIEKHSYIEVNPIPLTEEWLLKFGIKNKKLPKGGFEIFKFGKHFNITTEEREGNQGFLVSCEYVHQLQNLYFALTEEELVCL